MFTSSFRQTTGNFPRVHLVDALRGFALMGLFLVHAIEFFDLYWKNPVKSLVHDVIFFLFSGKAYALFGLLFGVSFFIILDKQAREGVDFRMRFLWRLVLLFILGTLNSMVYAGEVLQVLAFFGVILVFTYRVPNTWLIVLAGFFLLTPNLMIKIWAAFHQWPGATDKPYSWVLYEGAKEVWANGSLAEVLKFNLIQGSGAKWFYFFDGSRAAQLMGLFIVGLILGRIGFFAQPQHFRRIRKFLFFSGIAAAVLLFAWQRYLATPEMQFLLPESKVTQWYIRELGNGYFCLAFVMITVLAFIAVYERPLGHKILNSLAPVGRMTLTLYVAQSLIGVPFFYGYGLNMWDKMSQINALLLGIVVFGLQMAFAHWWLKRFYYGPLEWLWRAGTLMTTKVPLVKRDSHGSIE